MKIWFVSGLKLEIYNPNCHKKLKEVARSGHQCGDLLSAFYFKLIVG